MLGEENIKENQPENSQIRVNRVPGGHWVLCFLEPILAMECFLVVTIYQRNLDLKLQMWSRYIWKASQGEGIRQETVPPCRVSCMDLWG